MTDDRAQIVLHYQDMDKDRRWLESLRNHLPYPVITAHEVEDFTRVKYCIVGQPDPGFFAKFPNLRAIFSLWAGIDGIVSQPDFPPHVPLYRMIEEGMTQGMQDYVLGQIYYYHLDMHLYRDAQSNKLWQERETILAKNRTIGIMGLGALGGHIAQTLLSLGFCVTGWRASDKPLSGIKTYHGPAQLEAFLHQSEILVSLLPAHGATYHILNAQTLYALPKGACIINSGRGEAIDDDALLAALHDGQIEGATLDVFHTEPLPQSHPFWQHDKIRITPHIASQTRVDTGTQSLLRNITAIENDMPGYGLYNPEAGY
ncbi:MAG: glyoxylate/hydroxypyruvate reductase A [Pseudomonadota bacterium]